MHIMNINNDSKLFIYFHLNYPKNYHINENKFHFRIPSLSQ